MNSFWKRRHNAETHLTIEGWFYLVFLAFITIGSILRNVNLLVLMAGLMYAPLILQWRTCSQLLRNLKATRVVPQRIHAGKPVKMTWTVHNQSQHVTAWNVLISDQIARDDSMDFHRAKKTITQRVRSTLFRENENRAESLKRVLIDFWKWLSDTDKWRGDRGAMMSIDRVEGGQSRTGAWQVNFPVRGKYDIGPAQLSSTTTLGLQASHVYLNAIRQCYVAPALGVLSEGWVRRLQSMSPGNGTGMRRRGMDQEEFYALRRWRSGDSKKHIHWRTTARYGLPIVRQYDQNDDQDVAIVLDLYCPSKEIANDETTATHARDAETALSFATTVLSRAKIDVRGRITLGISGQSKDFFPGRQTDFLASTMKALAVAQPSPGPPTIETLLDSANVVSSGTPILVISTRPEPDLTMLAASTHQTDPQPVKQVSHAIVERRLQRIKSAITWTLVDSQSFRSLFSCEESAVTQKTEIQSSVPTSLEAQPTN